MSDVRVRFAPSPTGFFHIGSARTALFNWLYARHTGGRFVLRIEDTDAARNTEESLRLLLDGMRWLGLDWDEGPEEGGDFGPYFQSQRSDIYREYLQKLTAAGRTYEKDGATWFRLEGERYTAYDDYKKAEVEKVRADPVVLEDRVRGTVKAEVNQDFVIVRASGDPVFHFVNVVDDIAMGITHVIRGEDHLSNTPRHVRLFEALGAPVPEYAHIPLILKQSGPGKMSKRDQGALIEEYQQKHYLPEAVRNFLVLLGWNPKDDSEIMPIEEIIERFDFPGINQSNARFDERKMAHINSKYVQALTPERFRQLADPILAEEGTIPEGTDSAFVDAVLSLCQEKIGALADLPTYLYPFFHDDFFEDEASRTKVFKKGDPLARLREWQGALASQEDWSGDGIEAMFKQMAEANEVKIGQYIMPGRLAIMGTTDGPSFYHLLEVLGKDRVQDRLERFLAANPTASTA